MPSNCNDIRNDYRLNHGGTAQSERQPLAQQPDYVKVDEKTFADWIVFVRDYARFVQFYNNTDTPEGDWTDFWTANPAIILANLAAAPIDDFRTASRQLFIELQKLEYQDGSAASNLHLQQHLNQLFDLFTNLSWQLDRHIRLLPEGLPIKEVLRNRVNKYLSPALQKWIAWHKHAQATLLDDGQTTLSSALAGIRVLGANLLPTEDFYTTPAPETLFTDDWLPSGATDWATYLAGIAADDTVFGTDPTVATWSVLWFGITFLRVFMSNFYRLLSWPSRKQIRRWNPCCTIGISMNRISLFFWHFCDCYPKNRLTSTP